MKASLFAILAAFAMASSARAVDVTACGQVVAPNDVGVLVDDLNCVGAPSGSKAVILGHRSTLRLDGNTITAPIAGTGVSCESARRCSVIGPGWILGAPPFNPTGVGVASEKNVVVEGDIEIYGHTTGILATEGRATVTDLILRNNGDGIIAKVVKGESVFVLNSERVGIIALKTVRGGPFEIRDSGWAGIETQKFKLEGSSLTSNGFDGTTSGGGILAQRRGVLYDSFVDANELNDVPLDVITGKEPILIDSNCHRSAMLVSGVPVGTWGVCGGD
jgi:hypothetical protein